MVQIAGKEGALARLKRSLIRFAVLVAAVVLGLTLLYRSFLARVEPNEWGIEQRRFGIKTGIVERAFGPGLYFVPPGTTMHPFPRSIHVIESSADRDNTRAKARSSDIRAEVDAYFDRRDRLLGSTHRVIDALNVQTSDGYAVRADVTLLYSIADPVRIAKEFGWGLQYIDSFVLNSFRSGVLATLGKMNAESFYDETVRVAAVHDAEEFLRQRFVERGFRVEKLMLRNYQYADNYEQSLRDKKVAVQLAEKNRKESLVNEERAKLQSIESKGNAAITIAESEVEAQIAKIQAEAQFHSAETRARSDKEVNVAAAEAKRLKAEALTQAGGRFVVALETAKMFDNIQAAAMTPEQYIAFIRNAWAVIGVSSGSAGGAESATAARPPAPGGKQP